MITLEAKHLTKKYGSTVAVNYVSFVLQPGVHGLLGQNGAGKSTLIKMLSTALEPTEGEIFFQNVLIQKTKKSYLAQLGYMPQNQAMYPQFTAKEFLCYIAGLHEMSQEKAKERIPEVLATVDLADAMNQKIATFSGGMKQRLSLAQAVLCSPSILILDEPTAGLDPYQRISMRNMIAKIAENCIVLIATHIVSDIEIIARDILLMDHGHLFAQSSVTDLCNRLSGMVYETVLSTPQVPKEWITSSIRQIDDEKYLVHFLAKDRPVGCDLRLAQGSLEDVYLYMDRLGKLP